VSREIESPVAGARRVRATNTGGQREQRRLQPERACTYATTMVRASPGGRLNGPEDSKKRASAGNWAEEAEPQRHERLRDRFSSCTGSRCTEVARQVAVQLFHARGIGNPVPLDGFEKVENIVSPT